MVACPTEKSLGVIKHQGNCSVTLVLNRPEKLNPLDRVTVRALLEFVNEIELDKSLVSVVITGAGRAFSAGGDLDGYIGLYQDPIAFREFLNDFHALLAVIENSEKIYIAAINGACVAGGLELMLACDFVIASDQAKIGDGHINFAQLPGAGGSQRLPRAIGVFPAKQLMLTGKLWDAQRCLNIGLVSEVVTGNDLLIRCEELVNDFSTRSPATLRGAKRLVNHGLNLTLEQALQYELNYVHSYATTNKDAMEGLIAFGEKRKPIYQKI